MVINAFSILRGRMGHKDEDRTAVKDYRVNWEISD